MSSLIKPARPAAKGARGFQIRPKGAGSGDRIKEVLNRNRMENERAMSSEPTSSPSTSSRPSNKDRPSCPNPRCPNPSAPVQDGFCSACGREIDSSNIVAEVVFGETSSGAAIVQGSYVAADQGTTRNMAPGVRRLGGLVGDNREKTIREARNMMWGFKSRLRNVTESAIESAIMIFKLVLNENWLQGRGMDKVVPVCLYTACRREEKCDVMLIDFAELVHINVYELGHVFKDLSNIYSFQNNNVRSIIPEDLMMRFAEKLDFGDFTNKIAADATRLCQRMGRDWMVMGRRPSGICGACLLMAARMWNFRRTVREIVYVVKVTTHTIEQRLDEFTVTESSNLSIENFLNQEFLESRHDPPSFYKQSNEWKEKIEIERESSGRKRKRVLEDIDGDELSQANATSTTMPPPPRPILPPDFSKMRQVTEFLPRSFDDTESRETVAPFDPSQIPKPAPKRPKDVVEGLSAEDPTSNQAIDELVEIYGASDVANADESNVVNEEEEEQTDAQSKKGRRNKQGPEQESLNFDEEWERDEAELENQINEVINDPHSSAHSKALATAAHLAHIKAELARSLLPRKELKMDEIIGEDEFADDPEVQFCELEPEEVLIKEEIWLNANKDWVRKQQEKTYRQQMEQLGPPKRKRNRVKKPRMGEGQLTPASTPGEAAIDVMKKRNTVSKRINYDAIASLFGNNKKRGPGSVVSRMESESASRMTSRAGSVSDAGTPPPNNESPRPTTEKTAPNAVGDEQDEDIEDDEPAPVVYDYEDDYGDDGYDDDGGDGYDDGEGEAY
ncbi:hypothetical protein F5B22DRAFT_360447 [Xylaria bambusicola]|uniref:uncharacterized protein n=1 Tax=Xylaria bambusicola TaxID=326684 RepID=UPI002007B7C6|nr:uncharacterized protein F5B22DRAFT_360447 [Xylaria bambusicola]KAI0509316.1 hypothetical protein F5B22DRAFT_360447 [Xylaria bambusicola]